MADEIEILAYNPAWPDRFEAERQQLVRVLPPGTTLSIEHAGSTAVPHLAAKPIIDIFIAVRDITAARASFVAPLEKLDYVFWAENPDMSRLFFVKGMPPFGAGRTHHVHVMQPDNEAWQRTLLFRDTLRSDAAEAQRYLDLKGQLAALHAGDREAYTRAKDDYISDVVAKARRLKNNPAGERT